MEDHDRGRARPAFEAAIMADLAWLGLALETPADFRQSDDWSRYAQALERLAASGETQKIYGCDCTRKRLATLPGSGSPETDGQQELVYDGHCRERGLDWRRPGVGVRMRLPDATVVFVDGFHGTVTQTPARQCGDILLRDRHGYYTYQFAVVVDDLRQGVTLVVRGDDLLASTGRQILLARALGRVEPPVFAHHPLLVDAAGRKLGKRFFSESLAERRGRGDDPRALIGEALWRLGVVPTQKTLSLADAEAHVRSLLA